MTWMFVGYVDYLSAYLGNQAGDTSGSRCFGILYLTDGIPITRLLNNKRCIGRFLTLKATYHETLSLCLVKIYGFCTGS